MQFALSKPSRLFPKNTSHKVMSDMQAYNHKYGVLYVLVEYFALGGGIFRRDNADDTRHNREMNGEQLSLVEKIYLILAIMLSKNK